jgi:hypothetical protein
VIKVDGLRPSHVKSYRLHVHAKDCACHLGKIKVPTRPFNGFGISQHRFFPRLVIIIIIYYTFAHL